MMPQRAWRTAVLVMIALSLRQSAAADTYFVPPAPIAVTLNAGDRVVSANIEFTRLYPPQKAYIQLAVLGTPLLATPHPQGALLLVKPGVEDAPMPAIEPVGTVRSTDLTAVAAILERSGIDRADISTSLSHAPSGETIGDVRVAVAPPTAAQFNSVASKIDAAIAAYHNIAGVGTIVQLSNCDAESKAIAAAKDRAAAVASILAHSARLSTGRLLQKNLRPKADASQYQTICGSQQARPPAYDWGPPASGSLRDYPVSIEGSVVFRAQPADSTLVPRQDFIESSITGDYYSTLVKRQFIIPESEPFVSALGRFSAVVQPDALVVEFGIPDIPSRSVPDHLLDTLVYAIYHTGVSNHAMLREGRNIFVRLTSNSQLARLQEQISTVARRDGNYPWNMSTVPFSAHCETIRSAVAAEAYHQAFRRAQIMSAQARLSLGAVIAVNDEGFHDGAVCGYGKNASLRSLVEAIKQSPDVVERLGSGATFSCEVAVAWRLKGVDAAPRSASLPQPAPPYAYSTTYQPFITNGEGVLGDAKAAVRPTQAFLSMPPQQQITPALSHYFKNLWWEQSGGGVDHAGELRVFEPKRVKTALSELRKSGIVVDHVQFRSAGCEEAQASALREATQLALARAGSRPLQALIDQGSMYRPGFSICGLRTDVGSFGMYVGGSYTGYDTAEYSIEESVLAVTGK